jgi:Xaa-Pro aminopeptidase
MISGLSLASIAYAYEVNSSELEVKPGMVFTVEPGLYAANLGGFRHSDTVLITQEGPEILTYYPRELESLII